MSLQKIINDSIKIPKKKISEKVYIYGTGLLAEEIYKVLLNKGGYKVLGFLNKGVHKCIVGKYAPVFSYDDSNLNRNDVTVIIATFSPYADMHQIIKDLSIFGESYIVTFAELTEIFEDSFENRAYLNSTKDFLANIENIKRLYDLFSREGKDEKTITLLESIISFRISKDYSKLVRQDNNKERYFPKDIDGLFDRPMRFIDAGAYIGDTINDLFNHKGEVEAIAAFEPDATNYAKLIANGFEKRGIDFKAYPYATWSKRDVLSFSGENQDGSKIDVAGQFKIECVDIDTFLKNFNPTYIKFDVEGAEYESLIGTKKTIEKYRPNLAISIYHKPNDLWVLPLLIDSWNLNYKFYLRLYENNGADLVLYCIR